MSTNPPSSATLLPFTLEVYENWLKKVGYQPPHQMYKILKNEGYEDLEYSDVALVAFKWRQLHKESLPDSTEKKALQNVPVSYSPLKESDTTTQKVMKIFQTLIHPLAWLRVLWDWVKGENCCAPPDPLKIRDDSSYSVAIGEVNAEITTVLQNTVTGHQETFAPQQHSIEPPVELTSYDKMLLKCGAEVSFDPKSRDYEQLSEDALNVVREKFQEKIQAFKTDPEMGLGKVIVALKENMEEARTLREGKQIFLKIREMIAARKGKEASFWWYACQKDHERPTKVESAEQELAVFNAALNLPWVKIQTIRAFHALDESSARTKGRDESTDLHKYLEPKYGGPMLRMSYMLLFPTYSQRMAFFEGLCERDDALPLLVKLSQGAERSVTQDINFLDMYVKGFQALDKRATSGNTRHFLEKYPPEKLCAFAQEFESKETYKDCQIGWQCVVEALFKVGLEKKDISCLINAYEDGAKPFFEPIIRRLLRGTLNPCFLSISEMEELETPLNF